MSLRWGPFGPQSLCSFSIRGGAFRERQHSHRLARKMSGVGSAHHRSSSTFLDEYSGVTALYSYLMQSWKFSPPFLRRNLPGNREVYQKEMAELNAAKRAVQKAEKKGKGKSPAAASPSTRGGSAGGSQSRHRVDDDAPTRKTHSSRTQVIYRLRYNGGLQEWYVQAPFPPCPYITHNSARYGTSQKKTYKPL